MLAFDDPTMTQPLATQNTMIASVLEDFSTPGIQPTGTAFEALSTKCANSSFCSLSLTSVVRSGTSEIFDKTLNRDIGFIFVSDALL